MDNEKLAQAVDDLAIALGMWIGTACRAGTEVTKVQKTCYIEALVMLAKQAGLNRDRTLRPFDVSREIAEKAWDELPLQLRAGGIYPMRDGRQAGPIHPYRSKTYSEIRWTWNYFYWDENGMNCGASASSSFDLILKQENSNG